MLEFSQNIVVTAAALCLFRTVHSAIRNLQSATAACIFYHALDLCSTCRAVLITVELFEGLSELTRLAELRLHVPGWLKNALRLKMHNTRKIVAKFLLIYNGLYIACYDFLTYRRKF